MRVSATAVVLGAIIAVALAAPTQVLPLFSGFELIHAHDPAHPHERSAVAPDLGFKRSVHAVWLHSQLGGDSFAAFHELPTVLLLDPASGMASDLPQLVGRTRAVEPHAGGHFIAKGDTYDANSVSQGRFAVFTNDAGSHGFFEVESQNAAFRFTTDASGVTSLRRMHMDEHVCRFMVPPTRDGDDAETMAAIADAATREVTTRNLNVPVYNSKPGAPNVMYLDFDGHDATGSAWSVTVTQAYSRDTDLTAFSAADLTGIQIMWDYVAEDFAPFDVTITTDLAVFNAAAPADRSRCVQTVTDAWYPNAGGVAYVGVFSFSSDLPYDPAWVFSNRLGGGLGKYIAEAGTHEIGHNLGLNHDGTSAVGYYSGHGTGVTGWAPLMGVGYSYPLSQWSRGEYLDANNQQDDVAIISGSSNGIGYRADDHANSAGATATMLSASGSSGVIMSSADVDYFQFTPGSAGTATITVTPHATYGNLDVTVSVYSGGGATLLQTVNPIGAINAVVTQAVTGGTTYYVAIRGTGEGVPTGTGYTSYGSLGYYAVSYAGPGAGAGAVCGNSVIEAGEQCDGGACCTASCMFATSAVTCRSSAGTCDQAETCTGGSSACPADTFLSSATVCRSSSGTCDQAETCTGSAAACPADTFQPSSTVCRSSTGPCDLIETCTGSSSSCPGDSFVSAGTSCRASAGVCDSAEVCTGSSAACPADIKLGSGTVCRSASSICDAAETCNGVSNSCPADVLVSAGTVCRAASGTCDQAETCTGSSAMCPSDVFISAGTLCRSASAVCDNAEYCSGSSGSCPTDTFVSAGTVCRVAAGVCDLTETCTGSAATCPADARASSATVCRAGTQSPCDPAENCDGSSINCPANAFAAAGTSCNDGDMCTSPDTCNGAGSCTGTSICTCGNGVVTAGEQCDDGNTLNGDCCSSTCQWESAGTTCRAAAGVCDLTETCPGAGYCPADAKVANGVSCRTSAGPCDAAETCNGVSNSCPADVLFSAGTTCRTANGPCDQAETCTGSSASCPADTFFASGVVCRAAAGTCDVAETCSGTTGTCPSDAFVAAGSTCRASAGPCDVAESCSGSSAACPSNAFAGAGTTCSDGNSCTSPDTCSGASAPCPPGPNVCVCGNSIVDPGEQCDGGACCTASCQFTSTGSLCRASAGVCDVAESCSGLSSLCPTNVFVTAGSVCRSSVSFCDLPEACTGSAAACPADAKRPAGTTCDDSNLCTSGDVCLGGSSNVCAGTLSCTCGNGIVEGSEQCDDGNTLNGDCCSSSCQIDANGSPCSGLAPTGQCPGTCAAGTCTFAIGCCTVDSQCSDGLQCTTDQCTAGVCTNPLLAAGSPCSDNLLCTVNDACSGTSSVCIGQNVCPGGCGDKGTCCGSKCECFFGWHKRADCSAGPQELSFVGAAVRDTIAASDVGSVFTVTIPDETTSIFIAVIGISSSGTRAAASGVSLYASFQAIPQPSVENVVYDLKADVPAEPTQLLQVPSGRAGVLYLTTIKADPTSSITYQIAAGNSDEVLAARPVSATSEIGEKAQKYYIIAIVIGICCLAMIVAGIVFIVYRRRKAAAAYKLPFNPNSSIDFVPADGSAGAVTAVAMSALPPPPVSAAASKAVSGTVLYDFAGNDADEVSLRKGEAVTVLERFDDGWGVVRTSAGRSGVAPLSYIKEGAPVAAPAPAASIADLGGAKAKPSAPPPSKPTAPPPAASASAPAPVPAAHGGAMRPAPVPSVAPAAPKPAPPPVSAKPTPPPVSAKPTPPPVSAKPTPPPVSAKPSPAPKPVARM